VSAGDNVADGRGLANVVLGFLRREGSTRPGGRTQDSEKQAEENSAHEDL